MSKTRQMKIRSLTARFSPGHIIDWHTHDWLQLVYATSGVMRVQSAKNTWLVPSRRAVWIPPGLAHQVTIYGSVMMRTLYFQSNLNVFDAESCQAVNVSDLMRELIIYVCDQGIVDYSTRESQSLIELIMSLAQKMTQEPLSLPMPTDARALGAATSILDWPAKSLAVVAKENGSSVRNLQRLFSKETGISLGRWRNQARLLMALRQLSEGQQVTQVSLELGFESMSSFIYAFRKFFGVSPGKYFQHESAVAH